MLSCESCNYIKETESSNSGERKLFCELTGFVFNKKIEDYEIEYHPCYNFKIENNEVKIECPQAAVNKILKTA